MRVLLDEHLDHRLRRVLAGHDVFRVTYKGWSGLKNGNLLRTAAEDGFEVFLRGDQTMLNEVNLRGIRMAVIVVSAIEFRILVRYVPAILSAIERATIESVQLVDCGRFER